MERDILSQINEAVTPLKEIQNLIKSHGFAVNSTEKQARAFQTWYRASDKEAQKKLYNSLIEKGWYKVKPDPTFPNDVELKSGSNPELVILYQGDTGLLLTRYTDKKSKLPRSIDTTVSDKDYYGESDGKSDQEVKKCKLCGEEETNGNAVYQCPDCGDSFCTECDPGSEDGRCSGCQKEHDIDHKSFMAQMPYHWQA